MENRKLSGQSEAPRPSRRDLLRQCGNVVAGVAGTGLFGSAAQQATQEVTYPFKTWQLNGQDAYIFADSLTKTYYRTTTGPPQVRMSKNLVDWTAPITMLTDPPEDQRWFSNEMPWACEMHTYKGKYYVFYTRHNSTTVQARSELAAEANPYSVWQTQNARSTVIGVADSPLGPFSGLDNRRPAHDPRFMTLDGTFVVDEEGPWMVYCHEWVQKIDGTIEAIPLTPDLRAAAGDSILLFRGSDASWRRRAKEYNQGATPAINATQLAPYVTDGCELCRTPNGSLLMIWTGPGGRYSYNEVQAISRSGRVRGPWEQVYRKPFMHGNRGHGNLFRTFEGKDMLVVMNRSAQGGLANGTRSEYYDVEITNEGVEVLKHRQDLDGQIGLSLERKTPPISISRPTRLSMLLHPPARRLVTRPWLTAGTRDPCRSRPRTIPAPDSPSGPPRSPAARRTTPATSPRKASRSALRGRPSRSLTNSPLSGWQDQRPGSSRMP